MPHRTTATKSLKHQAQDRHATAAGPHGIALAPPTYGIDVVDRAPVGEGSLHRLPAPVYTPVQPQAPAAPNRTGLPTTLKTGIESLSGYDMSDVRVHFNSSQPARLQALAYTQGTDIYVATGQAKHLPHEAWHVVQQKQGRVQPTMQIQGVSINDAAGLEHEAEVMGIKALQMRPSEKRAIEFPNHGILSSLASGHHQPIVGHAAVQCQFRTFPNLFPDQDNQCYVGLNAMKQKITNAFDRWKARYSKNALYGDEATGFVYGETDNPYYVNRVEYDQIKQWWLAKNTPQGGQTQKYTFVETSSISQDPLLLGEVRDLISAPIVWQSGTSSKNAFNFHVRIKG